MKDCFFYSAFLKALVSMGLVLTPEYQLTGPWPLLLKSHLDDLVEATDELIRF